MLDFYIAQTQRLLQNPQAPTTLYDSDDLTAWINIARGQLAGESEAIRQIGTLATVVGQQEYEFADITIANSATKGIDGVINVRSVRYAVASGYKWVTPRSWEWFEFYVMNNPVPEGSWPQTWSQYAQGAAPGVTGSELGGTLYINKPDIIYTLSCDCVCFPAPLEEDADPEPIPYLWTDAVPFFAAYYALLSAQNNARMADAERYYNHYQTFVERARKASNPSVNRWMYQQAADPAQANKMQLQNGGGAR